MGSPAEDAAAIVKAQALAGESYYVEFKSAWTYGPEGRHERDVREIAADIGQTIVAFANSDGGDLLVGVEDDGTITGIPHRDERVGYLRAWQQQLLNSEGVSVRVFDVTVDGHRVLLFRTEASSGAVAQTSDGRCMVRKMASSAPASPREIDLRRAHVLGDRDYEARPIPEASLEDLNWALIRSHRHGLPGGPLVDFDDVALLRYWNLIEQRNGSGGRRCCCSPRIRFVGIPTTGFGSVECWAMSLALADTFAAWRGSCLARWRVCWERRVTSFGRRSNESRAKISCSRPARCSRRMPSTSVWSTRSSTATTRSLRPDEECAGQARQAWARLASRTLWRSPPRRAAQRAARAGLSAARKGRSPNGSNSAARARADRPSSQDHRSALDERVDRPVEAGRHPDTRRGKALQAGR